MFNNLNELKFNSRRAARQTYVDQDDRKLMPSLVKFG